MSSKLVKKQLGTILAGAVEKSQITSQQKTKKSKTDRKKLKIQQKQAIKERGPSVEAVRRANLQYFSQTTKPAAATQDLLAQALRSRGAAAGSTGARVEKEDEYGGDDADIF
jgi:hypothetical protein